MDKDIKEAISMTNNHIDHSISNEIKIKIVRELVEPSYIDDIKEILKGKKCWRITGQVFETISKIFVAVGSIMSFSSGYYNIPLLSFLSGSISTMSLAILQFSSFSYRENKKQGQELNTLLQKLKLDTMPVLERDADQSLALARSSVVPANSQGIPRDIVNNMEQSYQEQIARIEAEHMSVYEELRKEIERLNKLLENNKESEKSAINIDETLTLNVENDKNI